MTKCSNSLQCSENKHGRAWTPYLELSLCYVYLYMYYQSFKYTSKTFYMYRISFPYYAYRIIEVLVGSYYMHVIAIFR